MRKLLTTFTAAAICLSGGIALASPSNTPVIHISGKHTLEAKHCLNIDLSQLGLVADVQYDVSCHVINEKYADPKNAVILKLDGDVSAIRVNGAAVNSQFRVPQQDNVVQFKVTYADDSKATVINLDRNDSVTIENCVVIPTT